MSFLFRCLFLIGATSSTVLFGNYWTATTQLNFEGPAAQKANVSIDRFGVSVAVWEEKALPTSVIKGAILPAGATAWIPTSELSTSGVIDRALPQVRHDMQGNAIAIWLEQDGNNYVIRSSQLVSGTYDWISLGDVSGVSPSVKEQHQLAVNGAGKAVAIWVESSEGFNKLFGSKKETEEASWELAPWPISYPTYNVTTPVIAIDGLGSAVAIWRNFKLGVNEIAGAVLPHNSEIWTGTGVLGSIETPQAPHLAMNAAGKAVAVWAEGPAQKIKVKAATLAVGSTSWVYTTDVSAALPLSQQTPQVAIDSKGNAIVGYIGLNGNKQVLKAALLPQSTAIWVRTNDASAAADRIIPEAVHLNADGSATAVYQSLQKDVYTLKGSIKTKNSQAWTSTNDLSKQGVNPIFASTSFNISGTGISVFNRTTNIEGSVHFGIFPPSDFSGKINLDDFLHKRWSVALTWTAPKTGLAPLHYRIYSDAALAQQVAEMTIEEGSAEQMKIILPILRNEARTYYILSEDAFGGRSSAVGTTVERYVKPSKPKSWNGEL